MAESDDHRRGGAGAKPGRAGTFSDAERAAVYRVIAERRDVRAQFLPAPIAEDALRRILTAAHQAPSVGLSQPWSFVLVRDVRKRRAVKTLFDRCNGEAAQRFSAEGRPQYSALTLEGILDAPLNVCVTCDSRAHGRSTLGATHQRDLKVYSTVCAVQNLWLAARAEGIGVGWVSILDEAELKAILGIPPAITVVSYLCLGYVADAFAGPELEARDWARRLPLDRVVFEEEWGAQDGRN